jgi:hypothetical protein
VDATGLDDGKPSRRELLFTAKRISSLPKKNPTQTTGIEGCIVGACLQATFCPTAMDHFPNRLQAGSYTRISTAELSWRFLLHDSRFGPAPFKILVLRADSARSCKSTIT